MLSFTTHFWGEKNHGFDVLYQNMKAGQVSSRELEEYLRESCSVEESYVKLQMKLAKMAANYGNRGSFGPFWQVLRGLSEKLSSIHQQLSQSWQELIKEIHRYSLEQQKKHKEVKDQEGTTVDAVQAIQQTLVSLHKAKEVYHVKYYEYERLKRESSSQRDLEKAESKLKKSNEDYKALLDKYANARNDFVLCMTASCKRFQDMEEKHIQHMKDFIEIFSKARDTHCNMLAQVQEQFRGSCSDLSVRRLIEMIVQSKATGTEKPGTIEYIEADVSNLMTSVSMLDIDRKDPSSTDNKHRNQIGGILGIPIKYRSQKKRNKDQTEKDKDNKADNPKNTHLVDDEGYSIRPENVQNSRDSCDSSSDTDSDAEEKINRLKVEIKPKAPSPATGLDDIKNIIQTFKIQDFPCRRTPVNETKPAAHSSESTPTKPSDDLINLDISEPPPASSTVQNQATSSSQPQGPTPLANLDSFPSTSSSSSLSAVPVSAPSDRDSPFPSKVVQSSTSTQPPLIPGPISRPHPRTHAANKAATTRPTGRQTPDVFHLLSSDRSESLLSLNSVFSSAPNCNSTSTSSYHPGGYISRGPSPLTLAMSDTVPIAVAFSEVVDSLFVGADAKSFKIRIIGTVFISFPGGIMRIFLENPNPSCLNFTIKNTSCIENLIVKKPLLSENESLRTNDSQNFSFDMPSIIEHLRKLTEQNKNAKYFNVDIIKYQVKVEDHVADRLPLRLTSYWKAEPTQYDYRLDYAYQGSSMHPSSVPLTNIQVALQLPPVVHDIKMHSLPSGTWSKENKRVTWKLPDISDMSENGSSGNVKAKFDITPSDQSSDPSTSMPLSNVTFLCDGATLSGLEFELSTPKYRVSLVKKRFSTGAYLSQPEVISTTPEGTEETPGSTPP